MIKLNNYFQNPIPMKGDSIVITNVANPASRIKKGDVLKVTSAKSYDTYMEIRVSGRNTCISSKSFEWDIVNRDSPDGLDIKRRLDYLDEEIRGIKEQLNIIIKLINKD